MITEWGRRNEMGQHFPKIFLCIGDVGKTTLNQSFKGVFCSFFPLFSSTLHHHPVLYCQRQWFSGECLPAPKRRPCSIPGFARRLFSRERFPRPENVRKGKKSTLMNHRLPIHLANFNPFSLRIMSRDDEPDCFERRPAEIEIATQSTFPVSKRIILLLRKRG